MQIKKPPIINFGKTDFNFKRLTEILVTEDVSKIKTSQFEPHIIFPALTNDEQFSAFPDKLKKFLKKEEYKGAIITADEINVKNKIIKWKPFSTKNESREVLSLETSTFYCDIASRVVTPLIFAHQLCLKNEYNEIFIKDIDYEKLDPIEKKFILDLFHSNSITIIEVSDKKRTTSFLPHMNCETAEKYILFNKQNEKISPNNLVSA